MQKLGLRLTSVPARVAIAPPAACLKLYFGTRRLHMRQPLPYSTEEGLGNFLPPEALKVQLEYQDGLLERLNEQVAGTPESGTSVAQTVINLSGKRDKVLAFNYASLALNNSFFLSNLKPPPEHYPTYEHEIADNFNVQIRNAHGSIQQLRSAFSAAALGTFINGWVWFVADQAANTGIITTYGAGTLLVRSRMNMQRHPNLPEPELFKTELPPPKSTPSASTPLGPTPTPIPRPFPPPGVPPSSPLSGISTDGSPIAPRNLHPRFFHNDVKDIITTAAGVHDKMDHNSTIATSNRVPHGVLHAGEILYPLFCVPVYEHAWMSAGYGVWGKEEWLKEFWSVLNWQRVNTAYEVIWGEAHQKANSLRKFAN